MRKGNRGTWAWCDAGAATGAGIHIDQRSRPSRRHQAEPDGLFLTVVFAGATCDALNRQALRFCNHRPIIPALRGLNRTGLASIRAVIAKQTAARRDVYLRKPVLIRRDDRLRTGGCAVTTTGAEIMEGWIRRRARRSHFARQFKSPSQERSAVARKMRSLAHRFTVCLLGP